ncbi:hypothetical protein [Romboutsia sp.]|uniref:hypothetical protein n=1 Tax=Romboutsia sp. TaxID=1965302 RepID=UPI002BFBEBFC|nr:hypothetical protein [Romboutsia sp.]HSQ88082.1 hypothetical protein [Romboutsia sp.]
MNSKKIIKIVILAIVMVSIVVLIDIIHNKESETNSNKLEKYKSDEYIKDLKPISKANVINILKAEYGDVISVSENQIKQVGDEYLVEVYLNDEGEDEHEEEHMHDTSLGIHKINRFTGELILPN